MRRRKGYFSTIAFVAATLALVAVILFSVAGTVLSQSSIGAQELENYYRVQEKELLEQTREYLAVSGFRDSGVTLTKVVDAEGNREYTFTIHHRKIDKMSGEERRKLVEELSELAAIDENCTFSHEFL